MSRRFLVVGMIAGIAAGGSSLIGTANAQPVADFYKRTSINLYVGSGVGGGFDAYARILALHYGRHLPGNPSIVVKNMPGATGLVAMNSLYNTAPRDGSTILASFNTVILSALYGDANARFDPQKMGWLGSIGKQTATCLTWHETPVKTIEDARSQEVIVGATGFGSTPVMFPKLLNAMLETKFKIVSGYSTPGLQARRSNAARSKGFVASPGKRTWRPSRTGLSTTRSTSSFNSALRSPPIFAGFRSPSISSKIRTTGRSSNCSASRRNSAGPFLAPPGVPAERLAALQTAFDEMLRDKAYLADAERAKQFVDPLSAKEVEALIRRAYAAPKEIVARAAVYAAVTD